MNKKMILIVDDEPDILSLTSLRLQKLGFDIRTAVDRKQAIRPVKNKTPDLILLDLILPLLGGDEVCRKLKNDEKLKHIPIILFTASSNTITAEKAKRFGANDYTIKPFEPDELVAKINKAIACATSANSKQV